ncbi:hypothetical protein H0H87_004379, partial [Tephrocybe sp. NHM501043]
TIPEKVPNFYDRLLGGKMKPFDMLVGQSTGKWFVDFSFGATGNHDFCIWICGESFGNTGNDFRGIIEMGVIGLV